MIAKVLMLSTKENIDIHNRNIYYSNDVQVSLLDVKLK